MYLQNDVSVHCRSLLDQQNEEDVEYGGREYIRRVDNATGRTCLRTHVWKARQTQKPILHVLGKSGI
jgi:hypothetical protein